MNVYYFVITKTIQENKLNSTPTNSLNQSRKGLTQSIANSKSIDYVTAYQSKLKLQTKRKAPKIKTKAIQSQTYSETLSNIKRQSDNATAVQSKDKAIQSYLHIHCLAVSGCFNNKTSLFLCDLFCV